MIGSAIDVHRYSRWLRSVLENHVAGKDDVSIINFTFFVNNVNNFCLQYVSQLQQSTAVRTTGRNFINQCNAVIVGSTGTGKSQLTSQLQLDFVVLDELGYMAFARAGANCSSISSAGSTHALRSNLAFGKWQSVVGGLKMAAEVDRLTRRCEIVNIFAL